MTANLTLTEQTLYAELEEQCAAASFDRDFPPTGSFSARVIKGRTYWYFYDYQAGQRSTRYLGPDQPGLTERIARHRSLKQSYQRRKRLVAMLRRRGLTVPDPQTGSVLSILSEAGLFRLHGVVVGTVAFQCYGPILGVRLSGAALRTADIDIAQSYAIQTVVEDTTRPFLELLHEADKTFRPVPGLKPGQLPASYQNASGLRVDILTPNRGKDEFSDTTARLKIMGDTGAQPLRFLDYLIKDEIRAVVLHEAGVLINIPQAERFAVHKLIVATRRKSDSAKIGKDIAQASALIMALAASRPRDLADAFREARARGPKWREALDRGLSYLHEDVRAALTKAAVKR